MRAVVADRMEGALTQQACVAGTAWRGGPVGGVATDSGSAGLSPLAAREGGLSWRARLSENVTGLPCGYNTDVNTHILSLQDVRCCSRPCPTSLHGPTSQMGRLG